MGQIHFACLALSLCSSIATYPQNLVYVSAGPLYTFDPLTCATTVVGDPGIGFGDIALTPDLRLYGISSSSLYEINTATAQPTFVTSLPPPFNAVSLVALDNEHLLLESWDSLCVIGTDGTFSVLGHLGFEASGDLTWYQGDLYMTAGYSALIQIRLNESHTGIVSVDSVGVMQTTFGEVYGAVTVRSGPCANEFQMIAFDGFDVYDVDPISAQAQLQCLQAFEYGVNGAATSAELQGLGTEPDSHSINVFTPNSDGINDRFGLGGFGSSAVLSVYDRWGSRMYAAAAFPGWDGRTPKGDPCPDGVYYFIVQSSPLCLESEIRTGHVTLLR